MRTWKPDTCECCIEEIYDGDRIVGSGQIVTKCLAHASVPNESLRDVCIKENRMKNWTDAALRGDEPNPKDYGVSETSLGVDGDGNPVTLRRYKPGMSFVWSFSGSGSTRILVYSVQGATLTKAQKSEIDTKVNSYIASRI